EHFKSKESFTAEIRKTQLTHIAEVWEKLYMLEACVEDLVTFRNIWYGSHLGKLKGVDQGQQLISELKDMVAKDRFWLGEGLYYKTELYVAELERMLYAEEVSNEVPEHFR